MSDAYGFIFSDDPKTGTLTYPQLEARRKIAIALAARNRPYPKTIGEGLTALGEGLGEGYFNRGLDRSEAAQTARDTEASRPYTGSAPVRPAPGGASLDGEPATQALALAAPDAMEDKQPLTPAQASQQPQMPIEEWLQRTARNESGSRKDAYTLVGERSRRGDYPYGKYQVMGENIPVWTAKYLGKAMTPDEFLANPDAQEQVARGKGSEYLAKYGPTGAAAAWFAGEKGMNDPNRKGTLGTHVAEYQRRFNIPLVSRDQVVASAARPTAFAPDSGDIESAAPIMVASLGGGVPTPDTVPDPTRDAIAQKLAGPPPQQVAQVGPAPLPTAPPAGPRPQIAPSTAATLAGRPVPAGPVPTLQSVTPPEVAAEIVYQARKANSPYLSPDVRADARERLKTLQTQMQDRFTKEWTVWHEKDKTEREWALKAEEQQRAREKHQVEMTEAPYKLEHARKQAEPTTKEVDGRILERDPDSGKWNDVTPGGTLPNLTEVQAKTLGFYQRGKWALHNLGSGEELNNFYNWYASGMPAVGNYAVNAKFQRQLQAANELAAVQLRLETGTAAPPAELKNVIDRLLPRPGDKPEALLQKDQLRNSLVKSYADQMGSKGQAYIEKFNREFELDKQEYDKKINALRAPREGDRRGDHEYIGGDPANPASWKKFR